MSESPYQLRTLSKGLNVLSMIECSPEPLNLKAISDRMEEAGPVIFRVLKTLEAAGYIRRPNDGKKYVMSEAHDRLTMARLLARTIHALSDRSSQSADDLAGYLGSERLKMELVLGILRDAALAIATQDGQWSLSSNFPERFRTQTTAELLQKLRPVMARISEHSAETVALFVRNGSMQIALDVIASRQSLRYEVELGAAFPVNRGAAGKACLAWLEEDEIRATLASPALIDEEIDVPALLAELTETRARGYAFSFGERIAGTAAVSIPVWDYEGHVAGVLTVSGPAFRCPILKLHEYGLMVRRELAEIGLLNRQPADPMNGQVHGRVGYRVTKAVNSEEMT